MHITTVAVTSEVRVRNRMGQFIEQCDEAAERTVERAVREGATLARAFAPVDTGKLRGSIEPLMLSSRSGIWYADTKYALAQEYGAAPHPITGNPWLSFWWEREGRFFKPAPVFWGWMFTPAEGEKGPSWDDIVKMDHDRVNHPGNRAQAYLRPSYEIIMGKVMRIAAEEYPG